MKKKERQRLLKDVAVAADEAIRGQTDLLGKMVAEVLLQQAARLEPTAPSQSAPVPAPSPPQAPATPPAPPPPTAIERYYELLREGKSVLAAIHLASNTGATLDSLETAIDRAKPTPLVPKSGSMMERIAALKAAGQEFQAATLARAQAPILLREQAELEAEATAATQAQPPAKKQ